MPSFKLNSALLISALCGSYVSAINVEHWTTITVSGPVCGTSIDVNYSVAGGAAGRPGAVAGNPAGADPANSGAAGLPASRTLPGLTFAPAATSGARPSGEAGLPASRPPPASLTRSTTTIPSATSSAAGPVFSLTGVTNGTAVSPGASGVDGTSSPVGASSDAGLPASRTGSTDAAADSSATDSAASTDAGVPAVTDSAAVTTSDPAATTTTTFVPTETGSAADSAFAVEVLAYHNYVRNIHSAVPLTWDQSLADYAQSYADFLASDDTCPFAHSGGAYGENLAIGYPSLLTSMEAWYNEEPDYDYAAAAFVQAASHFTQMVWNDSTSIGCGYAQCSPTSTSPYAGGYYLVCEYLPRGNYVGEFSTNVYPPIASTTAYGGPAATGF